MAKITTITSHKGGTGKTTIAINLAFALSRASRVLLIDSDPQGSACSWHRLRKDNGIEDKSLFVQSRPLTHKQLGTVREDFGNDYEHILIDTPPAEARNILTSLWLADFALIPCAPSPLDILQTNQTIDVIQKGVEAGDFEVKPAIIISKQIVGTVSAREIRESLDVLQVHIFETAISQRVLYSDSLIKGQAIGEYPWTQAGEEFEKLAEEIKKWQRGN